MDEKIQRYIQRIDKIMFTPKKGGYQPRPSKSPVLCKPKNLDQYIKYELSTKIIQNIVNRTNQKLINQFFNAIRSTEFRQKERIYKFIAIEKTNSHRDVHIDATISGKLITAAIKQLIRKRYVDFINSLQEACKFSATSESAIPAGKGKLARAVSQRQSKKPGLARTTTNFEKSSVIVSEWIDDKSAIDEQPISTKQQTQRIRAISVKLIFKMIQTKLSMTNIIAFNKISMFGYLTQEKSISIDRQLAKLQQTKQFQLQQSNAQASKKIYQSVQSAYIITNWFAHFLSSIFNTIKQRNSHQRQRTYIIIACINKLANTVQRHQLKQFHTFFSLLQNRSAEIDKELFELQIRSKSAMSNNARSVISQPFNPLMKLNFYSFVDKIFKFIIIISKLLIPLKEAFIKIDHYASFSYRLEESLSAAPRSYLLQAFSEIKDYARTKPQPLFIRPELVQAASQLLDSLNVSIKQRLIQGFTHIKIISKQRELKIKIFPAKDNIIEATRRFIMERDSYTSQSHENWNGLKSLLLSPKNSSELFEYRKGSSIIP